MARSNSAPAEAENAATNTSGDGQPDFVGRLLGIVRSIASTVLITGVAFAAILLMGRGPMTDGDALQFTARSLDGAVVTSEQLKGKPVVLYFWATWCSACKLTTGSVEGFAERHPDVPVLAVTAENASVVTKWLDGRPSRLRMVAGAGQLMQKLGIRAYPTTVMIDAQGHVMWNRQGVLIPRELDARL